MYAPGVERGRSRPLVALVLALALWLAPSPAGAADGQITLAVHVSLAPTWFDPAETPGVITPFLTLYALHDALVKPMPGNAWAPCLAESWTQSKDGLTYEFVLRKGVRFHNGDPLTAEDVKFSFERYKGAAATTLKAHVAAVEVVDAAPRALPAQAGVARLHDVLRDAGQRGRLDRAEGLHRARWRGRLQAGAGRRGPVPLRVFPPRHRAGVEAHDGTGGSAGA